MSRIFTLKNNEVILNTDTKLKDIYINEFPKYGLKQLKDGTFQYTFELRPTIGFVLKAFIDKFKKHFEISDSVYQEISDTAELSTTPKVFVFQNTHIGIECPGVAFYQKVASEVGGYERSYLFYTVPFSRAFDVLRIVQSAKSWLPKFEIDSSVNKVLYQPLESFDGTITSLAKGPIDEIKAVAHAYRAKEDNFNALGYAHPLDFLLTIPRRYIDKTGAHDTGGLYKGDEVTMVGKIIDKKIVFYKHAQFDIDVNGVKVAAMFWQRTWMMEKFALGSEVLFIGKFDRYGRDGTCHCSGTSLESLIEAESLPIVPIYSQSVKNNVKTNTIMSIIQELFQRLGPYKYSICDYIENPYSEMDLPKAIQELHFPSSSGNYKNALNTLAYYELVYQQLLILHRKETEVKRKGLSKTGAKNNLVKYVIDGLPFELTGGQKEAIKHFKNKLASNEAEQVLLSADVGSGKGLLENEDILTPTGWIKMKDIKVGDYVVGRNGKKTKIIGVYPQGEQEVAKISFSDNTEIITDMSHLWTVSPTNSFKAKYKSGKLPEYTVSTGQLLNGGKHKVPTTSKVKNQNNGLIETGYINGRGYPKWSIPLLSNPVEYENYKDLPVDPYLLGYWLGDGSHSQADFAVGGQDLENVLEIFSKIWEHDIFPAYDKRNKCACVRLRNYQIPQGRPGYNPFKDNLKKLNLLSNKHIPEIYLHSSPKNRIALLQGLIDSDGSIGQAGSVGFGNTNKKLVDGVIDIVQSLGGVAWHDGGKYKTYNWHNGTKRTSSKLAYGVTIQLPSGIAPCRIKRKLDRYNDYYGLSKNSHKLSRKIVKVEKLEQKQKTICIKVDAEDELFVTKSYIVTHNTLIAQLSCLMTVDSGYQAVLAGPTDVLARQLYDTFVKVLSSIPVEIRPEIAFLSGDLKAAEKRLLHAGIASGQISIIVGTHSVLSTKVPYRALGLVVIDEQQKFGASQRDALLECQTNGCSPDIITQTATPIPRSTAQVIYGDIDLVTIKDKPAGRKDIETVWLKEDARDLLKDKKHYVWEDVKKEINDGHQIFVVVPMVFENAKFDIASIQDTYKQLLKIFPDKVQFIHGQMTKAEQKQRMDTFLSGEMSILVGSTVIEVGINVPNATRMIVLSADRMGASSLHQIRGRVGRSNLDSKCYLVSKLDTYSNKSRLESLVNSNNGFDIAEADLKVRGEGNLFGQRQSGESVFRFATLVNHSNLIEAASNEAKRIYSSKSKKRALKDAESIIKSGGLN